MPYVHHIKQNTSWNSRKNSMFRSRYICQNVKKFVFYLHNSLINRACIHCKAFISSYSLEILCFGVELSIASCRRYIFFMWPTTTTCSLRFRDVRHIIYFWSHMCVCNWVKFFWFPLNRIKAQSDQNRVDIELWEGWFDWAIIIHRNRRRINCYITCRLRIKFCLNDFNCILPIHER